MILTRVPLEYQQTEIVGMREKGDMETESKYLTKMHESPATSFFAFTNVLQPLVSKCRFGLPAFHFKKYLTQKPNMEPNKHFLQEKYVHVFQNL